MGKMFFFFFIIDLENVSLSDNFYGSFANVVIIS